MASFNLTASNSTPEKLQVAVFVNPKTIIANRVLYSDLFPVAWHVFNFPINAQPIHVKFVHDFQVFTQEEELGNIVEASKSVAITDTAKVFDFSSDSNGIRDIQPAASQSSAAMAQINNTSNVSSVVGICDAKNQSMLVMKLLPNQTASFSWNFEFALVPVTGVVLNGVFNGNTNGPWLFFKEKGILPGNNVVVDFQNNGKIAVTGVEQTSYQVRSSGESPFTVPLK